MMATIAWIILGLSGLGMIMLILSKLPTVLTRPTGRTRLLVAADSLVSYFWYKVRQLGLWLWHFVLEAKDIKPTKTNPAALISSQMDRVKKVFRIRIKENEKDPDWMPEMAEQVGETKGVFSKQNKTAEELYLETIKKDPNNKQAYEGLGRLYLQEKNFEEAGEIFKFLTRNDPTRDVYWSNLGISYYSQRMFGQAAASYEQALKINNKVPARWVNLALCFEAMEEHTRAIKAINKALELDPRNISYLTLLADIYVKVGNKVRSEEVLTQILSIEPTNKIAREKLMRIRI